MTGRASDPADHATPTPKTAALQACVCRAGCEECAAASSPRSSAGSPDVSWAEGRVREVGCPHRPTEGSRVVRCSPRSEEFRSVFVAVDESLDEWGGPSRTVAPGVSGSSPLGRPDFTAESRSAPSCGVPRGVSSSVTLVQNPGPSEAPPSLSPPDESPDLASRCECRPARISPSPPALVLHPRRANPGLLWGGAQTVKKQRGGTGPRATARSSGR